MEIKEEFKKFLPYLIGEPKQFLVDQGSLYCVAVSCDNCPHIDSCEHEDEQIQAEPITHSRRGLGFEEESFLVLRMKEHFTWSDVPKELWDNPYTPLSMDERNLHFILTPVGSKFRVLKGQVRFYGPTEEFVHTEYAEYFDIAQEYVPQHYVMSLDYSAQEPQSYDDCIERACIYRGI